MLLVAWVTSGTGTHGQVEPRRDCCIAARSLTVAQCHRECDPKPTASSFSDCSAARVHSGRYLLVATYDEPSMCLSPMLAILTAPCAIPLQLRHIENGRHEAVGTTRLVVPADLLNGWHPSQLGNAVSPRVASHARVARGDGVRVAVFRL